MFDSGCWQVGSSVLTQRGTRGPCPPIPGKMRMVGNGEPINGCLFHRVTKYRGFQDFCVRFSFSALTFRKTIVIIQIGLSPILLLAAA